MKHLSSFLLLSAVAALGPRSYAQDMFGRWIPPTGIQLFVDDFGSDTANTGLSRSSAFATIAHALLVADQSFAMKPVTINVLPGQYFISTSLKVPAYGITLEALDDSNDVTRSFGWKLIGTGSNDVIEVKDFFGPNTLAKAASIGVTQSQLAQLLPPSVVQNLDISGNLRTNIGIDVHPTANSDGTAVINLMEIRDCEIHHNLTGVRVATDIAVRSEVVIEHNRITDNNPGEPFPQTGIGLEISNLGVSSCLVRANRIWDHPTNVVISNSTGDALLSQDRLFSNFIEKGFTNIDMTDSAARIASNTIALASNQAGGNTININYKNTAINGVLVLLNNIIWSPDGPGINREILTTGANFTLFVRTNDIEDDPTAIFWNVNTPNVSGNFKLDPGFSGAPDPENLHISRPLSSLIWGGADLSFIRAAPNGNVPFPALMTMSVAGSNVRIDIPVDIDTDPRILQAVGEPGFTSDVGADEISDVGLVFVLGTTTALGFDQFGDLQPQSGTATGIVQVNHPAGATVVLAMGPLFTSSPVDTNSVLAPLGNVLLELNGSVVFVPPSSSTGSSTQFTVTLAGASSFPEAEIYLQAIVTPAGGSFLGSGWFSNRLRMEIDN